MFQLPNYQSILKEETNLEHFPAAIPIIGHRR